MAVHLGPPRANRKPVLHLVDHRGTTVSFVKVGINELTSSLVEAECGALLRLEACDLVALETPRVLHAGSWNGRPLLAQSPLAGVVGVMPTDAHLSNAMVEASTALGVGQETVSTSAHLERLSASVAALASTHRDGLLRGLGQLRAAHEHVVLRTGSWHGDWTPWNMTATSERVRVWDWERLAEGVPLGMDALHFDMQRRMRASKADPSLIARATLAERDRLLAPWGVSGVQATATAAIYLLTLGARYAHDGQDRAGARLGKLDQWLLPALDTLLVHDPPVNG